MDYTMEWYNQIAELLNKNGLDADTEFMGGGIICIAVSLGEYTLYFGTANETWGGDVYFKQEFQDGNYVETNTLIVDSVEDSASAILSACSKFRA
jgi:hypothetical protein